MNNDFEVMPIGTMSEVAAMRKFARELIELNNSEVPQPVRNKIAEIARFYHEHTEKFPVTI